MSQNGGTNGPDPLTDPDCQLDDNEIRFGPGSTGGSGDDIRSLNEVERSEPLFPHVTRALFPEGTVVALFGDLHGSIHSFCRQLLDLRNKGYLMDDWSVAPHW